MIRRDDSNETQADIVMVGGKAINFQYAGIQPTPGSPEHLEAIRATIQAQLDKRQRLNTLPQDEAARNTDPASSSEFWDPSAAEGGGSPGQTDLVSRSVVATVFWNGTKPQFRWTKV